jgi:hypothetical protein
MVLEFQLATACVQPFKLKFIKMKSLYCKGQQIIFLITRLGINQEIRIPRPLSAMIHYIHCLTWIKKFVH